MYFKENKKSQFNISWCCEKLKSLFVGQEEQFMQTEVCHVFADFSILNLNFDKHN